MIVTKEVTTGFVEEEVKHMYGIGVVIIHAYTGNILTVKELQDKERTGRKRGQVSIPLETRKPGEDVYTNLLGALPEVFDDVDHQGNDIKQELYLSLFHIGQEAFYNQAVVQKYPGSIVYCDIGVLIYQGSEITPQSYNSLEVSPLGWMSPSDFLQNEHIRPLAKEVVQNMHDSGFLEKHRQKAQHPDLLYPVLPADFSVREFYHKRERQRD